MSRVSCAYPRGTHVCEHVRSSHSVRGHFRGGRWIPAHIRSGSIVCEHCRSQDMRKPSEHMCSEGFLVVGESLRELVRCLEFLYN